LDEAAAALRRGLLVAFPTETVYGLGARALDAEAVARIYAAKGRPRAHPLIAHVSGEAEAIPLARGWSDRAARLAAAFWPGPLTLVVPRAERVPAAVAGGGDSIAVRAPAAPIARALLERFGEPVAAPSANRYQTLSPTRAAHVVASLGDRVDLVLDGGDCESGIESTVVDVRGECAVVLRLGALSVEVLRRVERDVIVRAALVTGDELRPSPGMDPRHYAPRARLTLVADAAAVLGSTVNDTSSGGILRQTVAGGESPTKRVRVLSSDPVRYAASLYATLHELDALGLARVFVEAPPEGEAWDAVRDRLARASS
jgi:L-threonylcarbamoyladenylate synthase